jgi:hypothetical protein
MTNRPATRSNKKRHLSRKRLLERLRRSLQSSSQERRPQLETLEERQLLALGPQLAGIQPNDGSLLTEGQVRQIAPNELVFHFSDEAPIDPDTIATGIRLTRSGFDEQFSKGTASTDFNTNRSTIIDFAAVNTGDAGNGISLFVIKNDLGFAEPPRITVLQESITVELNSSLGSPTRAGQLVSAINGDSEASRLLTAAVRSGTSASADIATPLINYSPIVTSGANAAQVVSNLNVGAVLEVRFTALAEGVAGNGTEVVIRQRDFGGVHSPEVTVNDPTAEERIITVEVNSNAASPTTVEELLDAINDDAVAGGLVRATLVSGNLELALGNQVGVLRLRLAGSDDIAIEPGFIGLGETSRQVVMRFDSPLPDDLYHIQILGTGPGALRNLDGSAFGDLTEDDPTRDAGVDFGLNFELDLGAQLLAVVPQPITRDATTGSLSQARNEIHIYFNDDNLHTAAVSTGDLTVDPSVVDPDFYQLLFTDDTIQNTDDVVYRPLSIDYDPETDRAILNFARSIDLLGSGAGTFRLRIGTDEAIPVPPVRSIAATPRASSDFGSSGRVSVDFVGRQDFSDRITISVTKRDLGAGASPTTSVNDQLISVVLNSNETTPSSAQDLVNAINLNGNASQLLVASIGGGEALETIGSTADDLTALTLMGLGSSFDTATDLAVLTGGGQIISAAIEAQQFDLQFPGSVEEPGHRDLRPELAHNFGETVVADPVAGVTTAFYNFQSDYGFDPFGNVLENAITEAQKQRAREAFSLYSEFLGIQFIETDNLGMTLVTGDVRALGGGNAGPGGEVSVVEPIGNLNGTIIMDLTDLSDPGDDAYGGIWFQYAMGGIGHLMGVGFTDEVPGLNVTQSQLSVAGTDPEHPENTIEPIFPGAQDVSNGQHLFRPDSKDIDLFQFELTEAGRFSAETFAERLRATSMLDTVITLYRERGGEREMFARNDDYFSNDSFLELDLQAGTYWVGVTASGNDDFDPAIADSGLGGRTQGSYDLRLNFRPNADRSIQDATGVEFDGDADGVAGGVADYWFRAQSLANTIIVDKAGTGAQTGRLDTPYRTISAALGAAGDGDVVRIVGNGGADGLLSTEEDNLAYEIGFDSIGNMLADGTTLEVPQNVSVTIDSGAVVKLRRARIGVGSSTAVVDRSAGSLQVLGTPVLIDDDGSVIRDEDGFPIPGSVFFTSIHDDLIFEPDPTQQLQPASGDWGGLVFRSDIDVGDVNRFSYERQGIFLNYVSNADLRYGGGIVLIDGLPQVITPIHITDARPTVHDNTITLSADAAMSASPNSFLETNFHSPAFQFTPFTSDYDRVGPDIHGNTAVDNSINGLFIRVQTPAGNSVQPLTVSGRWDDSDIPHIVAQRLVVQGTPGGHILEAETPPSQIVTTTPVPGGALINGRYSYRIVFVDADDNEGPPSDVTSVATIDDRSGEQSVRLDNLPAATDGFVSRRIYRSDSTGSPFSIFVLVAEINATSETFVDLGDQLGAPLVSNPLTGLKARQDARLVVDPGVVVKLNGGAIETAFGGDFYAEGVDGIEVVFTSVFDDRFGGAGTFDTNNDGDQKPAVSGDWAGIFIGPGSRASIDYALIAYGGGEVNIEGTFTGFNALEIHQSEVRVTHSVLEHNADGSGGQAGFDRVGRGFNRDAVIFVRGSQPVIVDNAIVDNLGPAISVDVHSLNQLYVTDTGRSTYGTADATIPIDIIDVARDNQGALVRLNRLAGNDVNGMQVRGGTLTSEGVWDDTDIVHVLRNERVYVPDFHTFGGLRLESNASESLVVKLEGAEAGLQATGEPLDNSNRIGGSLQIVGRPGHPVVLTSINDCTVGAGFTPNGAPMTATVGGVCVADINQSETAPLTSTSITNLQHELQARGELSDFVPDRLLIRFDPEFSDVAREEVIISEGAILESSFKFVGIDVLQLPPGTDVLSAAEEWSQKDGVEFAEPDFISQFDQLIPSDTRFDEQWGLHNLGQTGGTIDADIDAPEAWRVNTGSTDVVIAILDSGVDYNHADLAANMWRNPGEVAGDGIDNDGNGFVDDVFGIDTANGDSDPLDDVGHGTNVTGVAAAVGDNGPGGAGVAWTTQIMALKTGDAQGPTTVGNIAALNYVIMMKNNFGVNVVATNNSYGGPTPSQAMQTAIDASNQAGILFVASSGNGGADGIGDDNDANPHFPSDYPLDGIVSVAASDHNDQLGSFSNFGVTSTDLTAPGVQVLTTENGGGFSLVDGTSFSAPMVTGAVAVIASNDPSQTISRIKDTILSTVDRKQSLGGSLLSGGRLNLGSALNQVVTARSGDWDSVRLDQYSNDRNVDVTLEEEAANASAPGLNGSPNGAEFIGSLAPREHDDDDNRRLGFEITGTLGAANDVDVYSFNAVAGTEVWFDIDQTSNSLDTVVELIDASGFVLARSDNSAAETANPGLLFESVVTPPGSVLPLRKAGYDPQQPALNSDFEIIDHFSTNPMDAGMRVVLSGQPGATTAYHVRVRSGSDDLSQLDGGLTKGNYQLQIRLRELDEVPGSTVRFADIRYATNGIEILGQPAHSPLLGEISETEFVSATGAVVNQNDPGIGTAQELGNLAQTDQGAISIAGDLFNPDDVDFYRLTIEREKLALFAPNDHFTTIFDLDYADGLSRANTALWVFDSDGRLILASKGSNIADDRPRPLEGADIADLTRGSIGTLDPYIGPVELPSAPVTSLDTSPTQREVYFVAVSSNAQVPEVLSQFLNPTPLNPLVRLEPVNSIRRIAEDRIGSTSLQSATGQEPVVPVLLDPNESPVPFQLSDVSLFVSQQVGLIGNTTTTLRVVDPFTGRVEATAGSFPQPIADIALRGDGNLFAYTTGPDNFQGAPLNDGSIGTYVQIDTADASTTALGDDGVATLTINRANVPPTVESAPGGQASQGVGLIWDAITFESTTDAQFFNGWAVGSRSFDVSSVFDSNTNNADEVTSAGTGTLENFLFHFDIFNGVTENRTPGSADPMGLDQLLGAGVQKDGFGEVITYTRIRPTNVDLGDTFKITINGKSISYTAVGDISGGVTPQEVAAGLAAEWRAAASSSEEFAAYEVLNTGVGVGTFPTAADFVGVRLINPDFAFVQIEVEANNGGDFAFEDVTVEGAGPGGRIKGIDFINGQMYGVTDRGGLYQINHFGGESSIQLVNIGGTLTQTVVVNSGLGTYIPTSAADLMTRDNGQPIEFSGLSAGPDDVAGGRYANLLFGITRDGELYAFNTAGELQPIFANSQFSVSTGLNSVHGLEFSNLDRNLWTVTSNRGGLQVEDQGHGLFGPSGADGYEPFDHSRLAELGGGNSFYFGNDRATNQGGNNDRYSSDPFTEVDSRNFDFPDGAHGALISNPFSLAGYAPADLPVLYFNYFLETEDTPYDPFASPIQFTRDSFRVYVSDDSGEWTLLATNDEFQDFAIFDEFDIGEDGATCTHPFAAGDPCVYPLFDNTGVWRQARVLLSRFAGRDNLRLKFEFSSAGESNFGDDNTLFAELRAVSGTELVDGETLSLDFSNVVEFDLGFSLDAPSGATIQDGDTFTVVSETLGQVTFSFDNDNTFNSDILVLDGDQYRDGDTFIVSDGPASRVFEFDSGTSLLVPSPGAGPGGIVDGDTFSINGRIFEFDSDGLFDPSRFVINTVSSRGLRIPTATGAITDGQQFLINDGAGGVNVLFEFDSNRAVTSGAWAISLNNIELVLPIAGGGPGGIGDGDTIAITGGPTDVILEFDKDNQVTPGNLVVSITDFNTQEEVSEILIDALLAARIGLNPVDLDGGLIRLGTFNHTVSVSPSISSRTISATSAEIADRIADSILNAGLGLTPQNVGQGVIRLNSTSHEIDTSPAPSVSAIDIAASQDELSASIALAVTNASVGAGIVPINLGNGEVFIGQSTTLDTSGSAALSSSGAVGLNDSAAVPVVFDPTQTDVQLAAALANSISGSSLAIPTAAAGNIVQLPAEVSFSPTGSNLAPDGIVPIAFSSDLSPEDVAANIESAVANGFAPAQISADLTGEENDDLATAVDGGLTGGAADFIASGFIGDNTDFEFERARDVDFLQIDLVAGEEIVIEATGSIITVGEIIEPDFFPLNPAVRLFDSNGEELATASSTGRFVFSNDVFTFVPSTPRINFTAVSSGTYYVGVSDSDNLEYYPHIAGSADVTLQVPPEGSGTGGLTDGESFTIDEGNGAGAKRFEFDSDASIQAGSTAISLADVVIELPPEGTGFGGITDGEFFVVNDNQGGGDVIFEYDSDNVLLPGAISIRFFGGGIFSADPAIEVVASVAHGLVDGDTVLLETTNTLPGGLLLNTPYFVINSNPDDMQLSLAAGGMAINMIDAGTGVHSFTGDTTATLAAATLNALLTANIGLSPSLVSVGKIRLGSTTHTANLTGAIETLTATLISRSQQEIAQQMGNIIRRSGLNLAPSVQFGSIVLDTRSHEVDATLAPNLMNAIAEGTGSYDLSVEVVSAFETARDGDRINLTDVTDITSVGLPGSFVSGRAGTTSPDSTAVLVSSSMERREVAEVVADAIGRSLADYDEQIVGAVGALISDGEIFSVDDGFQVVNFEFESGHSLQIPDIIADPISILDGEFFTITTDGGTESFEFDDNGVVSLGRQLRLDDLAIRIPGEGMLSPVLNDGDTFTIDRGPGTTGTVFEFDTDGILADDTEPILVTPISTGVEVANAAAEALEKAQIGLIDPQPVSVGQITTISLGVFGVTTLVDVRLGITDHNLDLTDAQGLFSRSLRVTQDELTDKIVTSISTSSLGLSPSNLGGGRIHLGGAAGDDVDLTNAVSLTLNGLPGPSDPTSIVIPVFPSVTTTSSQVAGLIRAALDTARNGRGLKITTQMDGTTRVNLEGPFVSVDTTLAPALSVNRAGDSIAAHDGIIYIVDHTISDPGPFGFDASDLTQSGDSTFGAFNASGPILRGMDNVFEGVYIDDIIIGFAERGEMVLGATANTNFVQNSELFNPELPLEHEEIHAGPYQLEIRNAESFARTMADVSPELELFRAFDTNDRLTTATSIDAPTGSEVSDGQTFTLSDGAGTVSFEFDEIVASNGVSGGNVRIPFNATDSRPQMAQRIRDLINGTQVQSQVEVQAALGDGAATGSTTTPGGPVSSSSVINLFGNAVLNFVEPEVVASVPISEPSDTIFQAVPSGIAGDVRTFLGSGTIGDNTEINDPRLDVDLIGVELDPGESITIDVDTIQVIVNQVIVSFNAVAGVYNLDGTLVALNDDFDGLDPLLTFTASERGTHYVGISGFSNFFYDPFVAGSGQFSTTDRSVGNYDVRITRGSPTEAQFGAREFEFVGDSNVTREQGQILVHSNQISHSLEFGIRADAGSRDGAGDAPHLGPVRVTQEVNANLLAPGVTIANNVISLNGGGGIHFGGVSTAPGESAGAVPTGRIVNNTVVGSDPLGIGSKGIGIQVGENASPTLLNNIVAYLDTGVMVDPTSTSTILAGTLFQNNAADTSGTTVGSFPLMLSSGDELFSDVASGNFYLAAGSLAIDSSVDSVEDRPELVSLRAPLGIGVSPIRAPERDALGQTRVDDPTVEAPAGQGENIFKDRGALDRSDFAGPTALLLSPLDNDALGNDGDARTSFLELTSQVVTEFSIQLLDGVEPDDPQDGTGADDLTVNGENITILRDGVKLELGRDYSFSYDTTNNVIRLTPLAGIWEPDSVYEVDLANSVGFVLLAPTGTEVSDGDQFDVTDEQGNLVTFEYETGYVLQVPQTLTLQIPGAGGAAIADGEIFTISDDLNTAIFEFDDDNAFVDVNNDMSPDNELIVFDPELDSANDIANTIVAAIRFAPGIELSPVNILNAGGRAVHLGSRDVHVLDTSNTSVTQTGQSGGIDIEQMLVVDDGTKVIEFDFIENGGINGPSQIGFDYSQTHEQIADQIVAAIIAGNLNLTPTHQAKSDGVVHVGGTVAHIIDASDSTLTLTGAPGVRPEFGIRIPTIAGEADFETILTPVEIVDGETFTISNGPLTETFELDDSGFFTPGNHIIGVTPGMTADALANAIAIVIRDANLGLNPSNDGNGFVSLGGTASHSLDVSNTVLTQVGQPGVDAAEPVFFTPGDVYTVGVTMPAPIFTEDEMAAAIADAINAADAPDLLQDVSAVIRDEEVLIDGVLTVNGPSVSFLSSVRDVAGNSLKPNRADDTTQFTIFIGTGVDYGDAPATYGTLETDNGPRHETIEGFFLGSGHDIDIDGQPTTGANGDDNDGFDDEDGVVFGDSLIGGRSSAITVTASQAGVLDAWIDFNTNGDFEFSEQIADSLALQAGANTVTVDVPGNATGGTSYARFRFSSSGGLSPLGPASDGEVEDHAVLLESNPWRNTVLPMDVSGDTFITPIDVLLLINDININGSRPLPAPSTGNAPPPFLDPNGDGSLTAVGDVLPIINFLNSSFGSGGEGEGEGALGSQVVVGIAEQTDDLAARSQFTGVVDHRVPAANDDRELDSSETDRGLALDAGQSSENAVMDDEAVMDVLDADEFEDLLTEIASGLADRSSHDELFRRI